MRVFIQSKSGDLNVVQDVEGIGKLVGVLKHFRNRGGYRVEYRDSDVYVPFEEIKYIRKAKAGE